DTRTRLRSRQRSPKIRREPLLGRGGTGNGSIRRARWRGRRGGGTDNSGQALGRVDVAWARQLNLEATKQDTRQKQQEGRQHRLEAVSAHDRDGDTCVPHQESQQGEQHRKDESDLGGGGKVHAVSPGRLKPASFA